MLNLDTVICSRNCVLLNRKYKRDEFIIRDYTLIIYLNGNYRCIDCIKNVIEKMDLSYERMKKIDFQPWFIGIKKGRHDVLCALLEYGIERYDEYLDKNGNDSYRVLIDSFMNKYMKEETFEQIFALLVAAGVTIFGTVEELLYGRLKYGRWNSTHKFKIVCDFLIEYGFTDETPETLLSYTI